MGSARGRSVGSAREMAKQLARILMVGETVYKIHTHFKGFASYETAYATLGRDAFVSRFAGTGLDISFMPNHEVYLRFPPSDAVIQASDLLNISAAPAAYFLLNAGKLRGQP